MPRRSTHLDSLLNEWPYEFGEVNARRAYGSDGRLVLQMRIDLGVLQMEVEGRPDGARPAGYETLVDLIASRDAETDGETWQLDAEECAEVDREFVQFYHRRVAWLALRDFRRAVRDADHTLLLMDLCVDHAPSEEWIDLHERYRPFVLFHRTQAATLAGLEEGKPQEAIRSLDEGLKEIASLTDESTALSPPEQALPPMDESDERFDGDGDFIDKLQALRQSIVAEYELQPTLEDQLTQAIESEQYEKAAELRDRISAQRQA